MAACCKKDDCEDGKLPDCIQQRINISSKPLYLTVNMQKVNGECHYWLNTGAMAFDGAEYIVNDQCDTVCFYCGFCIPPDCSKEYSSEDWEVIWKP